MNKAVAGTDAESKSLEEVVVSSWNSGSPTPVFNNAAQVCVNLLLLPHSTGSSLALLLPATASASNYYYALS